MIITHCIKAFTDNYFWIIQPDHLSSDAYIVDPGNAQVVLETLNIKNLVLKAILLTHHHHDHIDGAIELREQFQIPIYGPQSIKIPMVTECLFEGDHLPLNKDVTAKILEVPGHTRDHIAYYFEQETPQLFSGDTIFSAGCGRIFDGDAESFFHSIERIKKLPLNTMIYAAHEYTLANLKFAEYIEPNNMHIQIRKTEVQKIRALDQPSLPTQLKSELTFNPFLRTQIDAVRERVIELSDTRCDTESQVFQALRKLKDKFV